MWICWPEGKVGCEVWSPRVRTALEMNAYEMGAGLQHLVLEGNKVRESPKSVYQMAHPSHVMVYVMQCLPGYILPMPLAVLWLGSQEQRISFRSFCQSSLWLPLAFTTAFKSPFQGNDSRLGPWRRLTWSPKTGTFSDLRNLSNHRNQEQLKRCNN